MKGLRIAIAAAAVAAWYQPLLAASDPPPGAASCSGCHSTGTTAFSISRLYGRDAEDITKAMAGFRDGSLPATVMNRIAKGFTDEESRAIAAWLAAQK
ncbi:cytochrome C [Bradyrhizobium sp. WSM 1738]|uniref:c-type cytochrome n=1 Tax=Bradyrhizobium hereditatis TaxID=2821405 RepID=UPI001CE2C873|nr:cytochrome C [Bradyrhizobium hereditatis]MCA6117542.1 cytochrome C [Bradyrhizobium hereditatis]